MVAVVWAWASRPMEVMRPERLLTGVGFCWGWGVGVVGGGGVSGGCVSGKEEEEWMGFVSRTLR